MNLYKIKWSNLWINKYVVPSIQIRKKKTKKQIIYKAIIIKCMRRSWSLSNRTENEISGSWLIIKVKKGMCIWICGRQRFLKTSISSTKALSRSNYLGEKYNSCAKYINIWIISIYIYIYNSSDIILCILLRMMRQ